MTKSPVWSSDNRANVVMFGFDGCVKYPVPSGISTISPDSIVDVLVLQASKNDKRLNIYAPIIDVRFSIRYSITF